MGMGGPSVGFGRDKENPLPSLSPISGGLTSAPPIGKVAPPARGGGSLGMGSAQAGADMAFDCSDDDDDIESSAQEQEEVKNAASKIDFNNFDYKRTDLNKLDDA